MTDLEGLTAAQVAERVARGQTNAFSPATSRTLWTIVRTNVLTRFNAVVGACFFALLLLGRWQDALFGGIALGNALIGFAQEYRAKRALDRLAVLTAPRARVRRDGKDIVIDRTEVVLDDLLVLRRGDQAPVDGIVVSSRSLQVDESMLTGEADSLNRSVDDEVISGSVVVAGEAVVRVTRLGADSFANALAAGAGRYVPAGSELRSSIDRLLTWSGWAIIPVGALVLNAQVEVAGGWSTVWATGAWVQPLVGTIAAVVAMIPLGLVLVTSLAFAQAAFRLADEQVLVNDLPAVETLARVDVICLDKTGTLTTGGISLVATHILRDVPGWREAVAWFASSDDANATARCLAAAFSRRTTAEPAHVLAFSSARRWSAASFAAGPAGTWVLGAAETVLSAGAEVTAPVQPIIEAETSEGRRVVVLAHTDIPLRDDDALPAGLIPVAVLALAEEVRDDARETLAYFRDEHVSLLLVSGDDPRTVAAIARRAGIEVGIGVDARSLSLEGERFDGLLEGTTVFGRVGPREKETIVRALQRRGRTVAMIGDGVNDVLAVRAADLGIAMSSGSAATRAAARVVLLDGRFSRLPSVVAEGRRVIANVERLAVLFLTKTVYATTLAIVCGLIVLPFPFLPRQLSLTDGVTIGIPALLLAFLPNTTRYRPGFLVRVLRFATPAGLLIAAALTAHSVIAGASAPAASALRMSTTVLLGVMGIWILTEVARPLSAYKVVVVIAMLGLLTAAASIPPARDFFAMVPLTSAQTMLVAGIAGVAGIALSALAAA
ncbi:MAG TPA: HAD-IC family P-type ATPase, partial [Microbacterium sp.]|uniref:HAD-IC family P-type ATPase n=1 Tax=Microbacterium sp. TaxID=51671 RepID=UPI002B459800